MSLHDHSCPVPAVLKTYQCQALDTFEAFLRRYRDEGSARAYGEITLERFGSRIPHRAPQVLADDDIPCVCLRVPTGGGKTLIGGHAIRRVNDALLAVERSLTLWLVPTEAIREQTLRALKTPGNLLHDSLTERLGAFVVLTIDEALTVQPGTLDSANTIVVATMQSFKQDDTGGLAVYKQNGALMTHFEGPFAAGAGNQSLVDALRLRRPFVIVDEAHSVAPEDTECVVVRRDALPAGTARLYHRRAGLPQVPLARNAGAALEARAAQVNGARFPHAVGRRVGTERGRPPAARVPGRTLRVRLPVQRVRCVASPLSPADRQPQVRWRRV